LLNNIIQDAAFADLMQNNIQEMLIYLFENNKNFGVLCNIEDVVFEPELPEDIASSFHPMTLFFLAGYTFDTARIVEGDLIFEAGFGSDNFGSITTVPLLSIMQVIIDETPVLINLSTYKKNAQNVITKNNNEGVENSMNSFLSNPENSKFLK